MDILWKAYYPNSTIGTCCLCYCIIQSGDFDKGHIVARANGGVDDISNLIPMCSMCNKSVGGKDLFDYMVLHGLSLPYTVYAGKLTDEKDRLGLDRAYRIMVSDLEGAYSRREKEAFKKGEEDYKEKLEAACTSKDKEYKRMLEDYKMSVEKEYTERTTEAMKRKDEAELIVRNRLLDHQRDELVALYKKSLADQLAQQKEKIILQYKEALQDKLAAQKKELLGEK